jgi:WD40 repeat protein
MRRLWSFQSSAAIRCIRAAREPGKLLVWEANQLLTWLSSAGEVGARREAPWPLTAVDCADDGSTVVAAGTSGQMGSLGADFKPRWQRTLSADALAVAVSPFGDVVAVADAGGTIHFLDAAGRDIARASNPRPFHHLVFIPERPLLIGSADFGSVSALDLAGRRRWHDAPVAHCGSLATTGDGRLIALACFSDGVSLYNVRGEKRNGSPRPGPCRIVALSYDGSIYLTAGLDGCVRMHDRFGQTRSDFRPAAAVTSLALNALGTTAFIGLADGQVLAMGPD